MSFEKELKSVWFFDEDKLCEFVNTSGKDITVQNIVIRTMTNGHQQFVLFYWV